MPFMPHIGPPLYIYLHINNIFSIHNYNTHLNVVT